MGELPDSGGSVPEKRRRLEPARKNDGGVGGTVLWTGVSAGLICLGLQFFQVDIRFGDPLNLLRDFLLVGIGGLYFLSGFSSLLTTLWRVLRFGRPTALMVPDVARPGERFRFRYHQPVEVPLTVDLLVSFVLRESITQQTGDGPRTEERDHLVKNFQEERLRLRLREVREREYEFQVPKEGAGAFNVPDDEAQWLVKVHMRLKRGYRLWDNDSGFWKEYEVPVERVGQAAEPEPRLEAVDGYEVVLVRDKYLKEAPLQALSELMPHLSLGELWALRTSLPAVVLRGVGRDQAETARTILEQAGAGVEVRCGGELVAKRDYPDLPIPGDGGEVDASALPVPAREQPGKGASGK